MGIYIHIPFCVKKCDYCDFYSLSGTSKWEQDAFHVALLEWFAQVNSDVKNKVVDTVYIGGGTPSCYDPDKLRQVLERVRQYFELAPDREITVECNPDSATVVWLKKMRAAGVNRLSMGVQSANDDELRAVGRVHDFETAQAAFRTAREAGFDNISLDLIYGLPGQTMERWQHSVEAVLALEPEHLSCYGLKVEEGTPLFDRQPLLDLADDDLQADMYLWMVKRLEQAGYGQYEISNFARPGRHSRHNMRYWLGQEYLGLGPGAHSYVEGERYSMVRNLKDFCDGVFGTRKLWDQRKAVDKAERVREYVLLRMRTLLGIEREEYESRYDIPFDILEPKLCEFERHGWVACTDGRWHFTPEGFLVSNPLIGQLLEEQEPYLE